MSSMRAGFGLHLEQTQKLVMTPELRQAITILQLPALELSEYLEQQLLENPLLEIKEEAEQEAGVAEEPGEVEGNDLEWLDYFQDGSDLGYIRSPREKAPEFSQENFLAGYSTLGDYLLWQLQLAPGDRLVKKLGEFLIGNIEESGYLTIGLEELAGRFRVSGRKAAEALALIQGFDPPGVGAHDLRECLLLQLAQMRDVHPLAEPIIRTYLEDLGTGRWNNIAHGLGVPLAKVQEAADFIRTLNPKPGLCFGSPRDIRYIVPDAVVERVGDAYVVLVNEGSVPRLGINPFYRALLGGKCDRDTKRFIEGKLNAAAWILRSVEQRRLTLYRVLECIIRFQKVFLEKGIKFLKPLNLRQVAGDLGLHESTVSRAISNKYVQTPQGVFELKFFFASGVSDASGSGTSSESVKKLIREFLSGEDHGKPYSDQEVTAHLNRLGINISRRTVAKYRDEIGIAAANRRRRFK